MTFLLVSVLLVTGCARNAMVTTREQVAVTPLSGRTGAFLLLSDAASRVKVVTAVLPGLLCRVSTPAGSGLAPSVRDGGGRVTVGLRRTDGDGPDDVLVVLNRDVRWDIRMPAGAGEQHFDLRDGRVTRVDAGPSGLVEMRLPAPRGTLPITLGSAGKTLLEMRGGAPMRLAGPGVVHEPREYRNARDRYAVLARSDLKMLTLRRV
jgi:hypothetical protein